MEKLCNCCVEEEEKTEDLEVIDVDDGVRGVGEHGAELPQPGSGEDGDEDCD